MGWRCVWGWVKFEAGDVKEDGRGDGCLIGLIVCTVSPLQDLNGDEESFVLLFVNESGN